MRNIFVILLFLMMFMACQDVDPLKPPDELSMNYGELVETTLFATADTFIVNERINTFNSTKLSIGNFNNFEAAILLKFIDIPDSGSIVDSLAIEFSTLSVFGESSVDMPVTLYRVEEEWYENANTQDQWHTFDPTSEITAIQIPSEDSTRIKFTIADTALIREWISDGIYNKGLYLKCSDPGIGYIREIASTEYQVDSLLPQISIRYWDDEDSIFVTDTTRIGMDATIFNKNNSEVFDIAQTQKDIIVSSGIGARAYLQFDELSSLPPNILIQKAELFIPIRDEDLLSPEQPNSFDNTNNPQGYYLNLVADSGDVLTTVELDSAHLNLISMAKSDTVVKAGNNENRARLGKYFIQNIVNENIVSEWFSIQYMDEGQDLSIKRFHRTADNPAQLKIKYFEVEQSGF